MQKIYVKDGQNSVCSKDRVETQMDIPEHINFPANVIGNNNFS